MKITFNPGDKVLCTRTGNCDNGNGEIARYGETYEVEAAHLHPLFSDIYLLYLKGKSPDYGFNSIHFRREE